MKWLSRKNIRIGLPTLLAALFFVQAVMDWQSGEGYPVAGVIAGASSLVLAVLYWNIEKRSP